MSKEYSDETRAQVMAALMTGQALGTGAQSQVLDDKASGKGLQSFFQSFAHAINWWVLPDLTSFIFVEKDYRDRVQKANIAKLEIEGQGVAVQQGIASGRQAMQYLVVIINSYFAWKKDKENREFLSLLNKDWRDFLTLLNNNSKDDMKGLSAVIALLATNVDCIGDKIDKHDNHVDERIKLIQEASTKPRPK